MIGITVLIIYITISLVLCDLSLLILHTNDMHARYEEVNSHLGRCRGNEIDCYGGFARLLEMARHFKVRAQAEGRSTLFLNAGDTFQGTPYYSQFKWQLAAKMINTLGLDVMSLGNHEFDDGVESLVSYINNVKVPIVCSNLDLSQDHSLQHPNLTPSKVLSINGTKVGIVGYLTNVTAESRNIGGLKILEEIPSIQEEARKLKENGVQIIIALGHSGYNIDLSIAKTVEDVDVVVGGHTHTFLFSGNATEIETPSGPYPTLVTQESGKVVPVVQAFFGTKYLGYLELDFDNQGNLRSCNGTPILLSGIFPQDQHVLRELEPYKVKLDENINRIIGYTHVFLDISNFKCKMYECEIGNLIADAFTEYMVKNCSVSISGGFINAGGIRSSIDLFSGGQNRSITLGDIMTVLPWGKPLVVLKLPGKVLLQALEHSITRYDEIKTAHVNNFLQVSGLRVTYGFGMGGGRKVSYVEVLCNNCKIPWFKPLMLEEYYGIVVPEYLAKGGDGFHMLSNFTEECVSKDIDYMILANYIENFTPVSPKIEGRIKIEHGGILGIVLLIYIITFIIVILILKDTISTQINDLFFYSNGQSKPSLSGIKHYDYSVLPHSRCGTVEK